MTNPPIVEIINNAAEPIPENIMKLIGEMRLKIEAKFPGRKFKFVVDKLENTKWDVKIQFEKPEEKK
jgi:hypothetical protein